MVNGYSDADIHRISAIDPWFLAKLRRIITAEERLLKGQSLASLDAAALLELKQLGFSDRQIACHRQEPQLHPNHSEAQGRLRKRFENAALRAFAQRRGRYCARAAITRLTRPGTRTTRDPLRPRSVHCTS